jgi:acyl carrier protein
MTKAEIISTINDFLIDEFEIDEDAIHPEASWKEVGIDSLDFVDIVVVVENVFGVVIKGEDMAGVKTLQEFYDFIEARINS